MLENKKKSYQLLHTSGDLNPFQRDLHELVFGPQKWFLVLYLIEAGTWDFVIHLFQHSWKQNKKYHFSISYEWYFLYDKSSSRGLWKALLKFFDLQIMSRLFQKV